MAKYIKIKKKSKMAKCCYNCKERLKGCKNKYLVKVCDNFSFSATCKSN